MSWPVPPDDPARPVSLGDEDETTEVPVVAESAPPVVAIVVTRNPGPFLEETLASFGAQDYPALSVLVVDAGSEHDLTARVAAALPGAFVERLSGSPGFGGAVNEAWRTVDGATFVLACHDDVVLDPPAVRLMVEEAYRSNAAIVGPKLVDAEHPDVLLEVGRAIDRLGGSHTGIEPGELDQEQHDAVRDVFYVSSAAMLIRADLLTELEGFDAATFPGAEDLDLCWRARLAGARVLVVPDARATHRQAANERTAADLPSERATARRRIRVVLTSYSAATLLWVVPVGLVVSFVEAFGFAFTHRRRAAAANFGAWRWNLLHWRRLRPARKRAQALRSVHDRDLHELQAGVGASFRSFLDHHRADERAESIGERSRDLFETTMESLRHPASWIFAAFVAFVLFGSRDLISHGVPSVGTLVRWPSVGDLVGELTSAWRHTQLGSTAWAPPALGMMAALGTLLFGSVGLAQTALIVGAFVVGSVGAFRLARGIMATHGAAAMTATVYGISAVPRNAVANGRLGPLVLYALAPFMVLLLLRAARVRHMAGSAHRPTVGLAIVTAIAAAWYPPAILVSVAVALALLVASPFVGEPLAALRSLGVAVVTAVGAGLLLAPWTSTLLSAGSDRGALGLLDRSHLGLVDALRFSSGPNGAGIASWGLVALALASLLIASGPSLSWAIRAWVLTLVGWVGAWIPARLESAGVAPEAALALAALGLAVAAGVTVGAMTERFTLRRLGWRTIVGSLALAGVVLGAFGFVADVFDGRWRTPDGWASTLAFAADRSHQGEFRILWVGDPSVLPLDPVRVDSRVSYVLTRNGTGDARELLRAPVTKADDVIRSSVTAARRDETSRLGRMLAPAGIRYVAVPLRAETGGARATAPADLLAALANQLDLARLGTPNGLVVYENRSWAPIRSVLPSDSDQTVPTGAANPLRSAVGVDLAPSRSVGSAKVTAGSLLLGEAYDAGWQATASGRTLHHTEAFGFVNGWSLGQDATVDISHDGGTLRWLAVGGEALVWIVAIGWWFRGRRRHAPRARAARRLERAPQVDPLADAFDEPLEFWRR